MVFARRLNRILEHMGTAEYSVPDDPQQLMADFYTLQLLEAGGPRYVPSHHRDRLERELRLVAETLLPRLKERLIREAGYSIARELRHLFDAVMPENPNVNVGLAWVARVRELLREVGVPPALARRLERWGLGSAPAPAEVSEQDKYDCAKAGAVLFQHPELSWDHGYGGPKWLTACRTWLQLYRAQSLADMAVYIDKLYSCEHNSGALLDKNPGYKGAWVKYMLDLKFQAREPEELMRFASPYLRRLGLAVLRDKYGRGWDERRWGPRRAEYLTQQFVVELGRRIEVAAQRLFPRVEGKPTAHSGETVNYTIDCFNSSDRRLVARVVVRAGHVLVSGEYIDKHNARFQQRLPSAEPDILPQVMRLLRRLRHL